MNKFRQYFFNFLGFIVIVFGGSVIIVDKFPELMNLFGSSAFSITDQITKNNLASPSSYHPVRQEILWERNTEKGMAYIVRNEYDAQNSMGAILRDCHYVSFIKKGDKFFLNTYYGVLPCTDNRDSANWEEGKKYLLENLLKMTQFEKYSENTLEVSPKKTVTNTKNETTRNKPDEEAASPRYLGKLTQEEENKLIFNSTNHRFNSKKGVYKDENCSDGVPYTAEIIDVNSDGTPEVLLSIDGNCMGGMTSLWVDLFVKNASGQWRSQFGFPGIPKFLNSKNLGFSDVEFGGHGECFPIWRWNGERYAPFKICDDEKLKDPVPEKASSAPIAKSIGTLDIASVENLPPVKHTHPLQFYRDSCVTSLSSTKDLYTQMHGPSREAIIKSCMETAQSLED